jgi:SAM-dependent methyltransferase
MAPEGTKAERQTLERFVARYGVGQNQTTREVELAAIGGDWGANGYTTVEQADVLGQAVGLGPATRLLDLGSGRGWPGLYLAKRHGCTAVLSDLPAEALRAGAARARTEQISGRVASVLASARHLPFAAGSFDAIVHTDVLC